jgi:hypothetical protein
VRSISAYHVVKNNRFSSDPDRAIVVAGDLKREVADLRAKVQQAHEKAEENLIMEVTALSDSLTARRKKVLTGSIATTSPTGTSTHRKIHARADSVCLGEKAIEAHIVIE